MKLIMESWRKFVDEYAAIKNRPALHIYPDPEMIINPAGQLDLEDAETLRNLLDRDMQNIGKDPERDEALANYTKRMQDLLDGLKKNPPEQKRSPEEIQKFKEIDQAVREVQALIQQNLMKNRAQTDGFGTPEKNIKTVQDFPPV